MRPDMHAGRVPPDEERFSVLVGFLHKFDRAAGNFLVDCLHTFHGERAGILAGLFSPRTETWVGWRRIVRGRGHATQYAAWAKSHFYLAVAGTVSFVGFPDFLSF